MQLPGHPNSVSYLKFVILLFLILPSFIQAQTSHRSLVLELLKDLQHAVSDSTSIPEEKLQINFSGTSAMDFYLNEMLSVSASVKKDDSGTSSDSVKVQLLDYSFSLNHDTTESSRNTSYIRQLNLNLLFVIDSAAYSWQGRISDKLSKDDMKKLLDENFPGVLSGDYSEGEPAIISVILTTLGVFSLGAALFFLRS